ncbi:MAG TPA: hypothetical protein PKA05_12425, partial [Roseiflexaceae bacterium]|nr:hypothetical protein [Roseiflexaceae bacterium]
MAIKSQYIISAIAILAGVIILWRSYGAAEPPEASPPTTARPIATPVVVGSGLVLTPIDRNLLDAYPVFEAGATMPSAIPDELVMPITPTAALPVPTEAVIPQPIVVVTAPA